MAQPRHRGRSRQECRHTVGPPPDALCHGPIGDLAGIAIPHYTDMKGRGLDSQVVSVVRHVATGEEAYFATEQQYTGALDELNGIVTGGIAITVASGNSGDLASSFRVHGTVA